MPTRCASRRWRGGVSWSIARVIRNSGNWGRLGRRWNYEEAGVPLPATEEEEALRREKQREKQREKKRRQREKKRAERESAKEKEKEAEEKREEAPAEQPLTKEEVRRVNDKFGGNRKMNMQEQVVS